MRGLLAAVILAGVASLLAGCGYGRPTVTSVLDGGPGHVIVSVSAGFSEGWSRRADWWDIRDDGKIIQLAQPPFPAPAAAACGSVACYRVVPGHLAVEASSDGGSTYTTVWQLTGSNYRALTDAYGVAPISTSLVVHGDVVFVGDGADGVLYRDAHGTWQRLGIPWDGEGGTFWEPPHRLPTDPQPFDFTWYVVGFAVLVPLFVVFFARLVFGVLPVLPTLVIVGGTAAAARLILMVVPGYGMFPPFVPRGMLFMVMWGVGVLAILMSFETASRRQAGVVSVGPLWQR